MGSGKQAEKALDHCGITVNMNMIPFDTRKPMDPSGIRIGTPALTTRGMGTEQLKQVGQWIVQALKNIETNRCSTAFEKKCESDDSLPLPRCTRHSHLVSDDPLINRILPPSPRKIQA